MNSMKTVPTDRDVRLHLPHGISFRGRLEPFEDGDGGEVFGWVCLDEGQSPDDWTDDVCWDSNENEVQSTRPTGWSELTTDLKEQAGE